MARRKKELHQRDQMLDELIGQNPQPEYIIGPDGWLKSREAEDRLRHPERDFNMRDEDDLTETIFHLTRWVKERAILDS
jgi:hypothetical protein